MSINAKLNRLTLDLQSASQRSPSSHVLQGSASTSKSKISKRKSSSPVAESWEDAASLSDTETKSPTSDSSTPLEAPGPDIKSPTTRAIDAEKELAGELPEIMPPPPPTPISPQLSNVKADWTPATALGGGRPTYTAAAASTTSTTPSYPHSNNSSSARSTPVGSNTPTYRYPTPNPPLDSTRGDWTLTSPAEEGRSKRPEKTTATANRLIAGALGIRAPPKTEEQRRYERAVKEQEIKKRNREKEEKKKADAEDERLKAAVWDA